ncbi:MAG: VOC family protein [Leptolyngbya sp. SIO1E4]|nr:VOC family protein [Leptolyngbya sp. SIO1E4]
MISAIHHVAIICADYARSKHFYTQVLGFEVVNETYRADRQSYKLDLQVNGRDRIELFSFPTPPARPSYPEACGLRHLAFAVADLAAQIAVLAANGITTEPIRTDELTGQRFTFFQDPDGLPLELYECPPQDLSGARNQTSEN